MALLMVMMGSVVQAKCAAVTFDYASFTRPPGKLDYDRYVAGQEQLNYLSLGLNGMTLQISPANTNLDQDLPQIWEDWRVDGTQHPDFLNFHMFHERPDLVATPFLPDGQGYRSAQLDGGVSRIEFVFLRDGNGMVMASIYLNDPVGDADWEAVQSELAEFLTLDPACLSESGKYEGTFDPERALFLIFPLIDFPIEGGIKLP